jgi:hypothetical protein
MARLQLYVDQSTLAKHARIYIIYTGSRLLSSRVAVSRGLVVLLERTAAASTKECALL